MEQPKVKSNLPVVYMCNVFTCCAGGVDYIEINHIIEITDNHITNTLSFNVTLQTDLLVEPDETFTIELASNDTSLNITQSSAIVTIMDATG